MGRCFSRPEREDDDDVSVGGGGGGDVKVMGNTGAGRHRDSMLSDSEADRFGGPMSLQRDYSRPMTVKEQRLLAAQSSTGGGSGDYRSTSLARGMVPLSAGGGSLYHGGSVPSTLNNPMAGRYADSPQTDRTSKGEALHSQEPVARVIAIYEYDNRVDGDISFRKGEELTLLDQTNSDWWYVANDRGETGYGPASFLARVESLGAEEWYAGRISRSLAEKLVCASSLPRGTFLVRRRGETNNEYALTINDCRDGFEVKHYKIRPMDDGAGFYITSRRTFSTIRDLVSYYSRDSGGLCSRLTFPAPRIAPIRPDLSHALQKNWEISRDEIHLLRKLGDGNFGDVFLGTWRGVVQVAVKTLKPGTTMSVEAFLAEAQILKECNDPKLIKLYAVCTTHQPFYLITEYMINGALLHYLRSDKNSLGIHALVDICAQIASGMKYLEARKLVHRDLAARNILVGELISGVPEVKVADFGLARKLLEENIYSAQATSTKFPIKWTAPEAATTGHFTSKSDVWSFGVCLYEIFTFGHVPYPGMQNREVIEQLDLGYRMGRPAYCPEPIYNEIMLKCWDKYPERRPTFDYLHSYFEDFFIGSAGQPSYVPPSVAGDIECSR